MPETAEGRLERVCFILQVKPERLEEYRERHKAVWPEMREALSATGWRNYSLFLRNDGLLVGYLETPSFEQALQSMAALGVNERWQREMEPFFADLEGRPRSGMVRLEQIFHLP